MRCCKLSNGGTAILLIYAKKHTLVVTVVMRDNAGEKKSKEIMELFYSVGVRNHFSTSHERGRMYLLKLL